jgi:SAM-dependent methyltransferase
MESHAYEEMYRLEDHHWWFVGKRLLVTALLADALAAPRPRILDAGCGTGGMLAHLRGISPGARAVGTDPSALALALCKRRGLAAVARAEAGHLPFRRADFDVVLLLDVLEHVRDEGALLAAVRRVLRPGGTVLVSVPAYQWLWSVHDEALHHVRRYTARRLRHALAEAGFIVDRLTYTNIAALPPAVIVRALLPRLGLVRADGTDRGQVAPWVNRLLIRAYRAEARLVRHASLPAGLSVAAVATHPK